MSAVRRLTYSSSLSSQPREPSARLMLRAISTPRRPGRHRADQQPLRSLPSCPLRRLKGCEPAKLALGVVELVVGEGEGAVTVVLSHQSPHPTFSSSGTYGPSRNSGAAGCSISSIRQIAGWALILKYFLPIASWGPKR